MSIYIKGQDLPKEGECYLLQINSDGTVYDAVGRRVAAVAVPVQPHGRLIDADVICEECRRVAEEYDGIYPDCTYCPVHPAPTIIQADPAEGGGGMKIIKDEYGYIFIGEDMADVNAADSTAFAVAQIKKPQTNYDRFVSKTPEELAKYIASVLQYREGDLCPPTHKCAVDKSCEKCWLEWLKAPVEDVPHEE